jgi:hypothetical protein
MIEIIITGETNKGKILLACEIEAHLKQLGLNVSFPLEGFDSIPDRREYAYKSYQARDHEKVEVVIKTVKHAHTGPGVTSAETNGTGANPTATGT